MTEGELLAQVTQLAELCGWEWAHFRPAQTARGWRTPVSGSMGKGWPDLMLARPRTGTFLLAELKGDNGRLSTEQEIVIDVLRMAGVAVCVWTPKDWETIVGVLNA